MKKTMIMLLVSIAVAAVCAADSVGSSFTYQGILVESGTPVDGILDLRFSLWDAETGGTQIGPVSISNDVAVSEGRVTTRVAVGHVMDGQELWLKVEVRESAGSGAFTVLDPRQRLSAAPYAAHSLTAGTAVSAATAGHATTADSAFTADDADTLDGQHGAYYLSWSNLTGVPGGLDDGDDDTLADLSCSAGEVASWNGSAWMCTTGGGAAYVRTIIVGPVGDAAANGAALHAASISVNPASSDEAVLIKVEPGEYDVTGHNFMARNWVSLEGSGRLSTRIFSESCGSPYTRVIGVGNGEIRDLTVENTCDTVTADPVGLDVGGIYDGARLARLRILLQGSTDNATGLRNDSHDAFFEDLHVVVDGADEAVGIESYGNDVFLIDSIVEANGVSTGTGFYTYSDAKTVISRGSFSGWGSVMSIGLQAIGASIDASDAHFQGDDHAVTMYGSGGDQSGNFSRCDLHGQLRVNGDGVDDMTVRVRHSGISGFSNTIDVNSGVGATARVAGSELDGGPVKGPVTCVAVWDEGPSFYPDTCP